MKGLSSLVELRTFNPKSARRLRLISSLKRTPSPVRLSGQSWFCLVFTFAPVAELQRWRTHMRRVGWRSALLASKRLPLRGSRETARCRRCY